MPSILIKCMVVSPQPYKKKICVYRFPFMLFLWQVKGAVYRMKENQFSSNFFFCSWSSIKNSPFLLYHYITLRSVQYQQQLWKIINLNLISVLVRYFSFTVFPILVRVLSMKKRFIFSLIKIKWIWLFFVWLGTG